MTYRFVQGIDYGPRSGTLGLSFHMSEGYDGLPEYLARHRGEDLWEWADRVNGVSCNAAILSTGEVVQMLDWGHASGNLNPEDRAGEYGYYGHHHLVDVLGDGWTNPNEYTISAELAGFRDKGPTDAQVRSAIKWGLEMRAKYPTIRGATGHHDQSSKECPGLTANMKAIFAGVGGHGLFTGGDVPLIDFAPTSTVGGTVTVRDVADGGARVIPVDGGERPFVRAGITRPAIGLQTLAPFGADRQFYLLRVGTQWCYIDATAVDFVPNDGPNPPPQARTYTVRTEIGGKTVEGSVTLP